ncbi:unnamed protein product [Sphagnum balticum]
MEINLFLAKLIHDGLFNSSLSALADAFNGSHAQLLAYLFSKDKGTSLLTSDAFVDLLANEILRSLNENTFHSTFVALSDPNVNPASHLNVLTDKQISSLSRFIDHVLSGVSTGHTDQLTQCQELARSSDRPLTCYANGGQSRHTENIFFSVATESLHYAEGPETESFFLKTLPLLLSMNQEQCDFPPGLIKDFALDEEWAREGYADGHRALLQVILAKNRFSQEMAGLKSSEIIRLAPILEEISRRGGTPFLLQLLGRDVTASDLQLVSTIMDRVATPADLNGASWVIGHLGSPSKEAVLNFVNNSGLKELNLQQLVQQVLQRPELDLAARDLKVAMGAAMFEHAPEQKATLL